MDVVLLHDARELPYDVYQALSGVGHRVVSHGADVNAVPTFLTAMRWRPEAFVVDFRGRWEASLEVARWLCVATRDARILIVNAPEAARVAVEALAPRAGRASDVADLVEKVGAP